MISAVKNMWLQLLRGTPEKVFTRTGVFAPSLLQFCFLDQITTCLNQPTANQRKVGRRPSTSPAYICHLNCKMDSSYGVCVWCFRHHALAYTAIQHVGTNRVNVPRLFENEAAMK